MREGSTVTFVVQLCTAATRLQDCSCRTCLFGLLMLDASFASTLLDAIPAETVNPSSCSTARRIAAVNRAPARRARSKALVGSTRWPAVPYKRVVMLKKYICVCRINRNRLRRIVSRRTRNRSLHCSLLDTNHAALRPRKVQGLRGQQRNNFATKKRKPSPAQRSPVSPFPARSQRSPRLLPPPPGTASPLLPSGRDTPRQSKPFRLGGNGPATHEVF